MNAEDNIAAFLNCSKLSYALINLISSLVSKFSKSKFDLGDEVDPE